MIRSMQQVSGKEYFEWVYFLAEARLKFKEEFAEDSRVITCDSIAFIWCY